MKTASVLAFERKLDPSDALFFSGDWNDREKISGWSAIGIREKSVRGTISNRLKAKDQDPAKLDASIESPNLQTIDVANLPADADTLKVVFTLRVLAGAGEPSACNDSEYREKLQATVKSYVDSEGFGVLARRYAGNLANGRFLWRNRIGVDEIEIQVSRLLEGQAAESWKFNALDFELRSFEQESSDITSVSNLISHGLSGKENVLLQVSAFVRLGAGQEVFPSQELILGLSRGDKGKTLYDVDGVAAFHSQKIGNALRTIDSWYGGGMEIGPIAVEPYGSVTNQGKAYRQPKQKMDFYSLLDGWVLKDEKPAVEQQHFVLATLIRGGVFGEA